MNKNVKLICLIIFIIIVGAILYLLLTNKTDNKKNNEPKQNENSNKNNNNGKSVVVYFSATGNTKLVAEKIAKELNIESFEIIPKEKYTSDDLNYNSDCRANREQNDASSRPEILNNIDISSYDTVYLGYPIWWGTIPKIILSFIDANDFTEKTIVPFCTSGSTDIAASVNDLRNYKPSISIKDGKRFSSSATDNDVKDFINNIK